MFPTTIHCGLHLRRLFGLYTGSITAFFFLGSFFALLMRLNLLTLALATMLMGKLDLGPFSMVLGLTFATVKAVLIASFFMHGLYESKVIRIIIAGGVIWFLIMITLTLCDYLTRG